MTDKEVILWAMGGGFAGTWALIFYMLSTISKLDEKITDIDRRLCRLEGAFSAKECCVIKEDRQIKKAE